MDSRFLMHNLFRESVEEFRRYDPQLRQLHRQPFVYHSPLLDRIDSGIPGIYTLTGGRQVGKSTFLKQFIQLLINEHTDVRAIFFVSCELINDHRELVHVLEPFLAQTPANGIAYLFIDEVTYVPGWDRAVKHLADTGQLDRVFLMLTGSDAVVIREAMKRFPGRRGRAREVDLRYQPLTFYEFLRLRESLSPGQLQEIQTATVFQMGSLVNRESMDALYDEFEVYLATGGYLTAINDLQSEGMIPRSTYRTYTDWIRGDLARQGKSDSHLKDLLGAILRRCGSQITWNNLTSDLSIDHPATVTDYIHRLESMDVLLIQAALQEHKLAPAPKKARKLFFSDPFIFHAVEAWITESLNPYEERTLGRIRDPDSASALVEGIVVNHLRRHGPTYYIKGKGEIDIAVVRGKRIIPLEVKWRAQVRKSDLRELQRFPDGLVATRSRHVSSIMGKPTLPLPLLLVRATEHGLPDLL
jgi:hypothetical protein